MFVEHRGPGGGGEGVAPTRVVEQALDRTSEVVGLDEVDPGAALGRALARLGHARRSALAIASTIRAHSK